MELLHFVIIYN